MFNEILKSLRARDGLSQVRFAEEIGFSQAAVSAWENNTREPGILALINIAKYFNVSVDYLVGNSSLNQEKRDLPQALLSKNTQELVSIFSKLDKDYQVQILEYARYFAERTNSPKKKA